MNQVGQEPNEQPQGKMIAIVQNSMDWLHRSRRKIATWAVGAVACVILYHAVFGANGMVVYQQKRTEYRQVQQKLADMQEQNTRLQKQIQALKSDPATIEKEAREQLRYTRPGEMIYILPEQSKNNPPVQTPAAAENHAPVTR